MRLLLPTQIRLALRRATTPPVPRAAAVKQRLPKTLSKSAPASSQQPKLLQKKQHLLQLWELSKETRREPDQKTREAMQLVTDGGEIGDRPISTVVQTLSASNDFKLFGKFLEAHSRSVHGKEKVLEVKTVIDVLWAAVLAKSLGSLTPSMLDWIEKAVMRLPEPIPLMKESMIWLLSILRDDFLTLQQLRQESCSKRREVGPEIERGKTLMHAALAYLEAGKKEEFRLLWTSSGTPILAEEEDEPHIHQSAALLHHALRRGADARKSDPEMLRWYAECLASNQRTPIPEQPQFETKMWPLIRALGGRIEKWEDGDRRIDKLRKWRDDYDDGELVKLAHSMLDYMVRQVAWEKYGSNKDLSRLGRMLRLTGGERMDTVVVDWLNFGRTSTIHNLANIFPSYELVVVGREQENPGYKNTPPPLPKENKRVKVIELATMTEKKQEVHDVCSLILAVATRGYLLTNDKTRKHVIRFADHLKHESREVSHSILLKNYLNDAVLRHDYDKIQPMVDHSRAAQWIDKEKKELAFTVARELEDRKMEYSPLRAIDYYSLHID